jgi:hypothetical protein
VETYTFSAPNSIGNTYTATINGKSVTYTSVSGDTAASVVTAMLALLQATTSVPVELTEIAFANPTTTTITATAAVPGTPFANVPGTSAGLVMSTGNGLANGITTAHTTASASPSDVNDPQNWLRVTTPAPGVRAIPRNGDDVVVRDSSVPMLWNLDQLAAVQFNTYTRWQSMTGVIGLTFVNLLGYNEWRATYLKFVGPQGSVPAGGLQMLVGQGSGSGSAYEYYNVGSQLATLTVLAGTLVRFLGVHTLNSFTLMGGVDLEVATQAGEIATLTSSTADGGGTLSVGTGVTWTAASTLTMYGGTAILNAAPATLALNNVANVVVTTDLLTWATVTAQGNCTLTWLAGGTITNLTMTTGCTLDKSGDLRTLAITNHTIDGDSCVINDPLNTITFTNAGTVKQSVQSGPYRFTGPRTVRVV